MSAGHPNARERTESETGAGKYVRRESEHARFIFTPLIGPCVAMMKRKLRSSGDEKVKGGGEMSAEMCV
jgi:hypothetical protein